MITENDQVFPRCASPAAAINIGYVLIWLINGAASLVHINWINKDYPPLNVPSCGGQRTPAPSNSQGMKYFNPTALRAKSYARAMLALSVAMAFPLLACQATLKGGNSHNGHHINSLYQKRTIRASCQGNQPGNSARISGSSLGSFSRNSWDNCFNSTLFWPLTSGPLFKLNSLLLLLYFI